VLYMDDGHLHFEYNALSVARVKMRSPERIAAGAHKVQVQTTMAAATPGAPAAFVMRVDGVDVASATIAFTPPLCFTASETFDVGVCLGSPVSLDFRDRAPFRFDGAIGDVHIVYIA
jgi:hypothetical protein